MNIGDKIKQLRTDKNLTQPQLADAIGIEQSYLSKLENDKSVPSSDIFQSILKALDMDVGNFLEGIDEKIVHRQLRQIPDVANYLNANAVNKAQTIKKWLYTSAIACVLGLTLIVTGYKGLLFSDKQFNYKSRGVVLADETADIFESYSTLLRQKVAAGVITQDESEKLLENFKSKRERLEYLLLDENRGYNFRENVVGGSRTYNMVGEVTAERPINRYLMLVGTLLTFSGLLGFFVELRLRKI